MDHQSQSLMPVNNALRFLRYYMAKAKPLWWVLLVIFILWFSVPRLYIAVYNEPFKVLYSPDQHYRLEYYDTLLTPPFNRYEYAGGFDFTFRWNFPMAECCQPGYVKLVRNTDNQSMGGKFYGNYTSLEYPQWHKKSVHIIAFYSWRNLL